MTASEGTDMADKRPSDAIMQRAAEWRAKLYAGDASAEDWAAFTDWMDGAPEHAVAYDIVSENESAFVDYLEQYPEEAFEEEVAKPRWQPWAIAASVALLLVTSLALLPGVLPSNDEPVRLATGSAELREFEIASGLNVTLNGETELVQVSSDASDFELIDGEALFAVGPEYSSRIRVIVGDLTIIDRGTVFNVSKGSGEYRISVAEGAVELSYGEQVITLQAGQIGTFNTVAGSLEVARFDPATIGSWTERRLEYTGASIDQVLLDASRSIGVSIDQGSCSPPADFAGTIQLSGSADEDVSLIADLLGCTAQTSPDGWVFAN